MVALGYFAFKFTLINGVLTFLEMILLSIFGLVIFTGIGFIISGLLENESSIAPVANTITLPQIYYADFSFPAKTIPTPFNFSVNSCPLLFLLTG